MSIEQMITDLGEKARLAANALSLASTAQKNAALQYAHDEMLIRKDDIITANATDMAFAKDKNLTPAMLDRLMLNAERIEAMADGLLKIAALPDPVGRVLANWQQENGLNIERISVPIGVIGIIYESRPNVTADAGALCLKSGNATILRGGSESFHSSTIIVDILKTGLEKAGIDKDAIQIIPTRDRAAVGALLAAASYVDVMIPRGGKSLIRRVMDEAKMPIFAHLEGMCHSYIDISADLKKAHDIVINAKLRRTGICGATETLLLHKGLDKEFIKNLLDDFINRQCELRGDEDIQKLDSRIIPASDDDWACEYLDAILSVKYVDNVDAAIRHINHYGSHHTDSIICEDANTAALFLNRVDSAIVMHNASTQFADGGEFGMGAEVGISTGRMHARGPVGVEQLNIYKYKVHGNGQCRP